MNARPATIQEFRDMMLYGRGLSHGGASAVTSTSGTGGLAQYAEPSYDDD